MAFHEPRIIDALRLTAEQRKKIRSIEGSLFARMRPEPPPPGRSPPPPRKRMEEVQHKALESVLNLLSLEQKQKWRELTGEPFTGAIFSPPPGPR